MKLIQAHLGLTEKATEAEVIAAIDSKTAVANDSKQAVELLMLLGRERGFINDQNEASYSKLAAADFDAVKDLIRKSAKAAEPKADPKPETKKELSLAEAIAQLAKGGNSNGKEDRSSWSFEDWQNKDEAGLLKMKADDAAKYASLAKAYYGNSVEI